MVRSAKSRHKNYVISMWSLLCLLLALVVSPFVFPMYTLGLWEFIKSSDSSKKVQKTQRKKRKRRGNYLLFTLFYMSMVSSVGIGIV